MKKVKAAVMVGVNEPFEVREFDITKAPKGYAGMKLIGSGICGTDIHIHKGKIGINVPTIIGHEFVGSVCDIDEQDSKAYGINEGDSVIADIACPCGECLLCKTGDDANCVHMGLTNGGSIYEAPYLYGGYTEYNFTPVKNLIKIPKELDPLMVCVFACAGPTAIHAFRLANEANCNVEKATTAVVQGLGPVGTFAVMYMRLLGIRNILAITAGNNAERESLAYKLGATEVINISNSSINDAIAHIRDISGGYGADVVFEASGNPKAVPQGMSMLRNRGVYMVPGQYSNSGGIEIMPQMITFNALRIIGSSQYSICDVEKYIEVLKAHTELHSLILSLASMYKVEDINKAIEDAKTGNNIKTMLTL